MIPNIMQTVAPPPVVVQPSKSNPNNERFGAFRAPALVPSTIRFDTFLKALDDDNVVQAKLRQNQRYIIANMVDGSENKVILPDNFNIVDVLMRHNVLIDVEETSVNWSVPLSYGFFIAMQLAIVRVLFGNNKAKSSKQVEKPKVSFGDVAGLYEAKRDLMEIVQFLKEPDKFAAVGARVPKGVMMIGGPGVGKTLLARAVAGEAGVPFYSSSGSEFIEMFAGVGAGRLRALFADARKNAPSVIFIDEIDSIGRSRNSANGVANDERDQTLNQLLTLMDGFETNAKPVIVMAATNRVDILDEALMRPGRFDRKVYIESPNRNARVDILKLHTSHMPLHNDVDIHTIAANTIGFMGADLQNLANEAAIQAVRDGDTYVAMKHWDAAIEKIIMGEPRNSSFTTEQVKQIAYHEAGHALVGILVNDFDELRKVSIVPRGHAGGVTIFQPSYDVDVQLFTKEYLENKLMVMLGGQLAETVIFGALKTTTGASSDFHEVMTLAYDIVTKYYLTNRILHSEDEIQKEVTTIVNRCRKRTLLLLRRNVRYLHILANALLEKGTVSLDDIRGLLAGISCCLKRIRQR